MLPILLKPKPQTGVIVKQRESDHKDESQGSDDNESLRACAADLIKGIHSGDEKLVASAIKSAFEILDSLPHEEGPHLNEDSE